MEAKLKAIELVENFSMDNTATSHRYAKKFALLGVDEIYNALYTYLQGTNELQNADREFAYWESVKKEIELL